MLQEENLARLREEEERRKEVSTKFNVTLSEISNLMKENSDKNSKLRDENQDMATRLQDLIKQYEAREAVSATLSLGLAGMLSVPSYPYWSLLLYSCGKSQIRVIIVKFGGEKLKFFLMLLIKWLASYLHSP